MVFAIGNFSWKLPVLRMSHLFYFLAKMWIFKDKNKQFSSPPVSLQNATRRFTFFSATFPVQNMLASPLFSSCQGANQNKETTQPTLCRQGLHRKGRLVKALGGSSGGSKGKLVSSLPFSEETKIIHSIETLLDLRVFHSCLMTWIYHPGFRRLIGWDFRDSRI